MEKEIVNEFWDDCVDANGSGVSTVWIWLTIIFLLIAIAMTITLICCLCRRRPRRSKDTDARIGRKASSRKQSRVVGGGYAQLKNAKGQN